MGGLAKRSMLIVYVNLKLYIHQTEFKSEIETIVLEPSTYITANKSP